MLIQGITIHLIVLLWWENVQKRRIQLISREWVAQKTYYVGDVRLGREAHTWISKVEPGHEFRILHCQADHICSINIY